MMGVRTKKSGGWNLAFKYDKIQYPPQNKLDSKTFVLAWHLNLGSQESKACTYLPWNNKEFDTPFMVMWVAEWQV